MFEVIGISLIICAAAVYFAHSLGFDSGYNSGYSEAWNAGEKQKERLYRQLREGNIEAAKIGLRIWMNFKR